MRADVCVGCRVSHRDGDTPDLRVNALRAAESGFVAVQHSDSDGVDTVDIYAVSPADLGAAVATASIIVPGK